MTAAKARAHRGVLVARCPRHWHPVALIRWPDDCAHREWLRAAADRVGLGAQGRGYQTRTELFAAIDQSIALLGPPPPGPFLPDPDH